MRSVLLPAALLCAALGLALAFMPKRALPESLAALAVAGTTAAFVPVGAGRIELLFGGCWVSVIVLAALVHLPRGVPVWLAVAAAVDAGAWSGLLVAEGASRMQVVHVLPIALIALPGGWAVGRGYGIALKVVSSWLIAIALLAALLPTVPTPGYVPDHMD